MSQHQAAWEHPDRVWFLASVLLIQSGISWDSWLHCWSSCPAMVCLWVSAHPLLCVYVSVSPSHKTWFNRGRFSTASMRRRLKSIVQYIKYINKNAVLIASAVNLYGILRLRGYVGLSRKYIENTGFYFMFFLIQGWFHQQKVVVFSTRNSSGASLMSIQFTFVQGLV